MAKRKYDKDSGQVYFELTVRQHAYASVAPGPAWAHESPFLPSKCTKPSGKDAPSLKNMAMRALLADQRRLSVAHLESLTWPLAKYLWKYLCYSERDTLYMWKLYATAFPQQFLELSPYHSFTPPFKVMPTRDYFNLISSDDLCWSTLLSISTGFLSLSELVDVARVTNLAALEISSSSQLGADEEPSPTVLTDRVLRNWGELADTGGAFKQLRLLVLRSHAEVTDRLFSYLDHFPSLVAVMVIDCPLLAGPSTLGTGHAHGWKARDVTASRTSLQQCFTGLGLHKNLCNDDQRPGMSTLPLLEVALPKTTVPPFVSESQRWFTRKQPKPVQDPPSRQRKVHPTVPDDATCRKRPALRPLSKKHMRKNIGLVQEFLGGPYA
ncbi:hypothetical protein VTO42DRAFT_3161 [Malbranchea cinnamomea]